VEAGAGATTAVGSDVVADQPVVLVAVTVTTTRFPASVGDSDSVLAVWPGIAVHVPPFAQSDHWYLNLVRQMYVHVPVEAVSSWPTVGVPEIVGGETDSGGLDGFLAAADPTTRTSKITTIATFAGRWRRRLFILLQSAHPASDRSPISVIHTASAASAASASTHATSRLRTKVLCV